MTIKGSHKMTSSNGNIFRVTGHLCWEFTCPRLIPHKGQWRGALMFSWSARINGWVNNREAGDLRRIRAHYDVIVMNRHPFQALLSWNPAMKEYRHRRSENRTLQWRHNECDVVSNHQRLDCLLTCLLRRGSKKTSKLRVTGLCEQGEGNPLVTGGFSSQWGE